MSDLASVALRNLLTKYTLPRTSRFVPKVLFPCFSTTLQVRATTNDGLSMQFQPSHLDDVEDIEGYRTGGFHPVHIGDAFGKGRYRVIHKLGYGGFSTVWLARDGHLNRYVALKIITAQGSNNCKELQILDRLRANIIPHPGERYIASILDYFKFEGPNGTHMCLVSQVAGPAIAQLSDSPGQVAGSRRLRADLARRAAWQATEALSYLHSRGIVHGDFTPTNILFQLSNLDEWSESQLYEKLGEPVEATVKTVSGGSPESCAPTYLVQPLTMSKVDPRWISEDILLIDFGQSFLYTHPPSDGVGTPMAYRAPELIFDNKASISSDLWALGCTIFAIRAGAELFMSFFGGPNEILRQMAQTLGRLPEPWWSRWEDRHLFFNDAGKPKETWPDDTPLAVEYPLRKQIQDIGAEDGSNEDEGSKANDQEMSIPLLEAKGKRPSDAEVDCMEDLLSSIVKYEPTQRSSIEVIAKHPWFTMKDARASSD